MSTMTRDELADRLAVLKREDWPRFRLSHLRDGEASERLLEVAAHREYADLIDAHLRQFVPGECPGCGHGWFSWGLAHGSGQCSCGWPATLYHSIYDTRDIDSLACSARCNGHPVCTRPRSEHVLVDGPFGEPEFRCPAPTPPPGVRSPFTSRWRAPVVIDFTALLWVHPYEVHLRPKKDDDGDG